jgi:hypothetical protein
MRLRRIAESISPPCFLVGHDRVGHHIDRIKDIEIAAIKSIHGSLDFSNQENGGSWTGVSVFRTHVDLLKKVAPVSPATKPY